MPAYPWLLTAKVDDTRSAPTCAACARSACRTATTRSRGRRPRARQERNRSAHRLPAGARHRGQVTRGALHGRQRSARRSHPAVVPRLHRRGRWAGRGATGSASTKPPTCPLPTTSGATSHERLPQQRLVPVHRHATVVSLSPVWCCCSARCGAADGRRQQHRPRVRREPDRAEQPDADVVDGPVRADRLVRADLRLRLSRH